MYWRPYDMKIIITVALSALAVTSTAAAIPDPNAVSGYDARAISRAASPTQSESPDDRAFSRAASPAPLLGADDRALPRATVDIQAATPKPVLVTVHDGDFVWGDAAIGAAAGLGFFAVLLGAALAVLITRSRRVVHAA